MADTDALAGLTATSFHRGNVAADAAADTAGQVFVLDMQESLPGVIRLRDWALAALAPQPGETAVDVGSGTGAEVRRLAAAVGESGRAVGIEPHAGLRAVAEQRSAGTGATFVDAEATALPFEDASVDMIRCERVFQHLTDPAGAVLEFARVLRPGGRVVVIDSDWGTAVQTPGDPDVVRRLADFRDARSPNPHAGRHLPGQFARAGLTVDPDIAATAVIPPTGALLVLVEKTVEEAVGAGAVTQAEGDALLADIRTAQAAGEAFMAVTMFAVLGRR
ncbi:SAM-dependent methyltransferase [Nocardioides aromaticivorans]|uniref:SAM-dependent methyltransferase n=1 Tax=Nocardioides aromaticivorans TaxID=200618 RepID=A0ABX7PJQ3_9ACTN|nr:methyltransferase domain-containing protein [Nocardioides aromaticivorans]QSR26079.1 SAM-dependent methyltransferase [Nocardioides aromaticivorans]